MWLASLATPMFDLTELPHTSLIVMMLFMVVYFLVDTKNAIESMSTYCIGFVKLHFHFPCQ
jgi:hypothetical protein